MLSRFELLVIARNQVSDRRLLRRALALEAVMEELAGELAGERSEEPAIWGLAGLGADLDAQLCASSPARRGAVAAEILETEGAPPEVSRAVRERLQAAPTEMGRLAAGLVVADALVGAAYAALDDEVLDALDARLLAHGLRRAAERRGDPAAQRALDCLAPLGLALERAAERALGGLLRVRGDLRL